MESDTVQQRELLIRTSVVAAAIPAVQGTFAATQPLSKTEVAWADEVLDVVVIKGLEIGKGIPKVVASITAKTASDAFKQVAEISSTAEVDIAEFRLDNLDPELTSEEIVELINTSASALADKPLLVTFRTKEEGGEREIPDRDYFALYHDILDGASLDLIDIEMMKPERHVIDLIAEAHRRGVSVILSNHEFESTPAKDVIVGRLLRQQKLGADILKIATMPRSPEDVLTLISASMEMKCRHAQKPLLTMAMGPLGVTTRLAGELTGSALTYASVGSVSAPGQLPAESVKTVLEIIAKGTHS